MGGEASAPARGFNDSNALGPLSAFTAQSYASTEALFAALLELLSEQLGMGTTFLTEITSASNQNHILASYNLEGGCNLEAE